MKHILPIIITLNLFCTVLIAQNNQSTLKDSLLKEWEKLELFKKMAQKELPGFGFYAALIWDGKIISAKKMGYANRETKLPMDENTIFLWGSISKMFTSIATIQLIEKGKLRLNDPVVKYIPELGIGTAKYGGMKSIKIHHFLNHNSGLNLKPCYDSLRATYPRFKNSIPSTKEMLPFLKLSKQYFKPGTKFRYSNGGYSLLGIIIERVTKTKFTKYVTRNIFKPLGMKTAHYGVTPKKLSKYFTRAYYRMKNDAIDTMNFDVSQGFQEGNGGVKATVKDMLKFMDFLKFRQRVNYLKNYEKVLSRGKLDYYFSEVNVTNPNSNKFSEVLINKLWEVYRLCGFTYVNSKKVKSSITGHSGNIAFHTSYFYFNNIMPFGVLLMINVDANDRKAKESRMNSKLFISIRDFMLIPQFKKRLYTWKKRTIKK
mgnify:CR=1 FL=1